MTEEQQTEKKQPQAQGSHQETPKITSPFSITKGRADTEEEATSLWLITFTDIMALMLTFFVLLYSMSVPQEEEWDEITNAVQSQFSKTFSAQWYTGTQNAVSIDKIDFTEAQSLTYLNSVFSNIIDRDERLKNIELIPQKNHLIVSVPEELLFESGQSEVASQGKQVLYSLGNSMARIRNRIEVIGHTDPRPIETSSGEFSSNWELSLARAASVAALIENAGYSRPITIRGFSSARYDDLPKSISEEDRLSLARRVDILVMQDDGSERQGIDIFQKNP